MGNYKKLGKNMFLVIIGTFSSKLLNFLLVPLYTSTLSTEEYGVADLIFVTVNLLLPIFTVVIFEALLRFALDPQYDNKSVLVGGTVINLIGVVIFLLLSPILLLFDAFRDYYFLFVACFLARVLYENLIYFLRGINNVGTYSLAGVINTVLMITLNVTFLVFLKMGVEGYLLATALSYFVTSVVIIFLARIYKLMAKLSTVNLKIVKEMLHYSLPMVPNSVSWWVSNSSNKYVITMFHGASLMGIYSVALKIPSIVNAISSMFDKAWQISSVDDFGSESSKKFYQDVCSKYTSLQLICTSGVILMSNVIATLMFKKGFFDAVSFVPLLVFGAMFHSFGNFFGTIYTASKHTNTLFYSTMLAAGCNIVANFILIPEFGGFGAAFAMLGSYFTLYMYRLIHSRKYLKFRVEHARNFVCFFLLGVQVLIHYLQMPHYIIFSVAVFAVIVALRYKIIFDILDILRKYLKKLTRKKV